MSEGGPKGPAPKPPWITIYYVRATGHIINNGPRTTGRRVKAFFTRARAETFMAKLRNPKERVVLDRLAAHPTTYTVETHTFELSDGDVVDLLKKLLPQLGRDRLAYLMVALDAAMEEKPEMLQEAIASIDVAVKASNVP